MRRLLGLIVPLSLTLLAREAGAQQPAWPAPAPPPKAPAAAPAPPPTPAPAHAPQVAPPAPGTAPPPAYGPPQPPAPAAALSSTDSPPRVRLHFFEPAKAFELPPPPPPPSPSVLVSAFFRAYGFVAGSVDGALPHLGATVGGSGAAFMLGFLPSEGLVSLGVELPRFRGVKLSESGALNLALLGPTFETHLFTDFSDNLQMNAGASLLGLGISSCSGKMAFFAQLRGPMLHGWLPIVVDGQSDMAKTRATPYLSLGAGLEAGLVFF